MCDIDNIKYPFNVKKMDVEGHKFYVIESCSLKGLSAQGDTLIDALNLFVELEGEWLETAKQYNIPIPEGIKIVEIKELNNRINDAFTELDTQRNRMSGLTRENSELKQKIIRLEDKVHNLRIFLALFSMIAVGIWYIQWVL